MHPCLSPKWHLPYQWRGVNVEWAAFYIDLSPLVPIGPSDLAFPLFPGERFWKRGEKEGEEPLPIPALETQSLMPHHISGRNHSPDGASLPACLWLPFSLGSQQMLSSLSTNVWEEEPKLGLSGSVSTTNPWLPGKTHVINPS